MALHLTNQFRRSIDDDPTKCILWVGAGLSARAVREGGRGLPDWSALMQRMIADLRDAGGCEAATLDRLEQSLRQRQFLEVAQVFKQKTRPDQFASFIKAELDPPDIVQSVVHRTILDVRFRGIITTNFDRVFEKQSDLLVPLVFPQCLDDVDGFRRHGFFAKIHGCVRVTPNLSENLVLSDDSFRRLRANLKYQTILRSCIVMHPILTVGFSLEDPDFLGLIDDLTECLGTAMPTLYSLIRDPGTDAREEWLQRGVQIIPYDDHSEILGFFQAMSRLSEERHPAPTISPASHLSAIDFEALLEAWRRAKTLDEATALVDEQLERLESLEQQEEFLLRLLVMLGQDEQLRLVPHLVHLETQVADRALHRIFEAAAESRSLSGLPAHPRLSAVQQWLKTRWLDVTRDGDRAVLGWLLDEAWGERVVLQVFEELLHSIKATGNPRRFLDLYAVCEHVAGAKEIIERLVLAHAFVSVKREDRTWLQSAEQRTQDAIRLEQFRRKMLARRWSAGELVQEAERLDSARGGEEYPEFTTCAAEHLIEEFVHRSHLTVHSSSDLYDPEKAAEIVNALALLRMHKCQIAVFWAINRWPERMRGFMSLSEDIRALESGLLQPLWWRFSSDTRIDYLRSRRTPDPHGIHFKTGQEFLLNNVMGLQSDIDAEFRQAFIASLASYRTTDDVARYEPRPLQELWRDRELSYLISDDVPPELVRRVAVARSDWENSQPGSVRWKEARNRAEEAIQEQHLNNWLSAERRDFAVDNLLGAYVPSRVQVVLYRRMLERAANELNVEQDALSTVVFLHETVHAFCHIGRDHDGAHWSTYAIPLADSPDSVPNVTHEAFAQFYTFKLLEQVRDDRLMSTFVRLETACSDVYRAWRATEHYRLEQMREVLMRCRGMAERWPAQ